MSLLSCLLAFLAFPQGATVAPTDTTYFQQDVSYRIEAILDEEQDVLRGRARVAYTNRSPDTLDSLYFHLYLNAFRPNSAWARRELEQGESRFQDLGPEEWGFETLHQVTVDGAPVELVYPGAPDSTVVGLALPNPLAPDETVTIGMDWDARPSSLPRRQGRRGRHYDFAQWFPIVAVYDRWGWEQHPLLPQGEFYGEFMTFDVTLSVNSDQVIGATGVPVEGDPGWKGAAAPGYTDVMHYKRDVYGETQPAESLGLLPAEPASGRKHVRWRAEDVHNFAWSTAPDFIYEGGMWEDVAIHVLYQPGDSAWAQGQALDSTKEALEWLDSIYGDFAWPQITNLHRIEDGGTEFPMVVMDGRASLGLIIHEVGHNYTMGILANNEWKEGFLDEGMTSFQTSWYMQMHTITDPWSRAFEAVAQMDSAGFSQPVATESADFRDYRTYAAMTYTKASVIYRMLQAYLGDSVFRQGLQRYYAENKLRHVTLHDFRQAMEEASGQELEWFFDQWFRSTDWLDYSIAGVESEPSGDGNWLTTVEITRDGEAWMPVSVQVGEETRLLDSRDRIQSVEFTTTAKPERVILDPEGVVLDKEPENDTQPIG